MKKILYLNHVCWEWIFQRPQIIALMLQDDFEITVLNKKFICGRKLSNENIRPKKEKCVYLLPGTEKANIIKIINSFIYNQKLKECYSYDIVWVCHPDLAYGIPEDYNGKIVYDCMDNHVAMAGFKEKEKLRILEQDLINRSDLVFTTSQKLKDDVSGLENAVLCRNGYKKNTLDYPVKKDLIQEKYKIGYFGTISSWMDFSLIKNSLDKNKHIEYHFIGPVEDKLIISKNVSTRLIFEGIIEHGMLGNKVCSYDALIMPFIVNDIILSVDPVKLYEYISFGKCIISVWYPEIERFAPFVYFYKTNNEFLELIDYLCQKGFPAKYNYEQKNNFLKENTWESRYQIIKKELCGILEER